MGYLASVVTWTEAKFHFMLQLM